MISFPTVRSGVLRIAGLCTMSACVMLNRGTAAAGQGVVVQGPHPELPAEVAAYIASYETIRTLECDLELYTPSQGPDDPRTRLRSDNSWAMAQESHFLCVAEQQLLRHRSKYHHLVEGQLEESEITRAFDGEVEYSFSHLQRDGQIRIPDGPSIYPNPLAAAGWRMARVFSSRTTDLAELCLTHPVQEEADSSFVIRGVFAKEGTPVFQDIHFALSETNGYLPDWIRVVQRAGDTERTWWSIEVNRFGRVEDISIPVEFLVTITQYRKDDQGGLVPEVMESRYRVNPESIAVNKPLKREDFVFEFPEGSTHYDWRTGTRYGQRVTELAQATPTTTWRSAVTAVLALSALILFAFLAWWWRRRMVRLALLLALAGQLGCDPPRPGGADLRNSPIRVIDSPTHVRSVPADQSIALREAFVLQNVGTEAVVLDRTISATCGCAEATVSASVIPPGGTVTVTAVVSAPSRCEQKVVDIHLKALRPAPFPLPLRIVIVPECDWQVEPSSHVITGIPGGRASGSVVIRFSDSRPTDVAITGTGVLSGTPEQRSDNELLVPITIPVNGHGRTALLTVMAAGRVPERQNVSVTVVPRKPANWTPRAVRLSDREQLVFLNPEAGVTLSKVTVSHPDIELRPVDGPHPEESTSKAVTYRLVRVGQLAETNAPRQITAHVIVNGTECEINCPIVAGR